MCQFFRECLKSWYNYFSIVPLYLFVAVGEDKDSGTSFLEPFLWFFGDHFSLVFLLFMSKAILFCDRSYCITLYYSNVGCYYFRFQISWFGVKSDIYIQTWKYEPMLRSWRPILVCFLGFIFLFTISVLPLRNSLSALPIFFFYWIETTGNTHSNEKAVSVLS